MACAAGLKPFEIDGMPPSDVWLMIEGYNEREKTGWEQTRLIAYNVAKFGNSDPKKFPKKVEKFLELPWDKHTAKNPKEVMEDYLRMQELKKEWEAKK